MYKNTLQLILMILFILIFWEFHNLTVLGLPKVGEFEITNVQIYDNKIEFQMLNPHSIQPHLLA